MSSSGINYYYTINGLPTEDLQVFYDFNSSFNGQNLIKIANSTGSMNEWTIMLSFEKKTLNEGVLFSNFSSGQANSGFVIGVNSANKIYLESYDQNGPVVIENPTILGGKNAVAISKVGQSLYVDYFDFNSKITESNQYSVSETAFLPSSEWYLGGFSGTPNHFSGKYFSGYIDNFLLLSTAIRPSEISELFKGYYTDMVSGQPVINSGDIHSYGMNGVSYLNKVVTSDNAELYLFPNVTNKTNLNKDAQYERTVGEFFGFENQTGNDRNAFLNGVAQVGHTGYNITGGFYDREYVITGDYLPSGYQFFSKGIYKGEDRLVYDIITGPRLYNPSFSHTSSQQDIDVNSSWDLIFFNGVKLVLNVDYIPTSPTSIRFEASNSLYDGVTGKLFSMPIDPQFLTQNYYQGVFSSTFNSKFARNTSMFWMNGIRQNLAETYLEISNVDLLSGSGVFSVGENLIFNNTENFWEAF